MSWVNVFLPFILLAKRRASPGYARNRGFGSSGFPDVFLRNLFCLDFTDGTSVGTISVFFEKYKGFQITSYTSGYILLINIKLFWKKVFGNISKWRAYLREHLCSKFKDLWFCLSDQILHFNIFCKHKYKIFLLKKFLKIY